MSLFGAILEILVTLGSSRVCSLLEPPTTPAPPPAPPSGAVAPPFPPARAVDPKVPKAQFVGPRVAVPGTSACQVCGEALKGGLVACPACATLCHESCWDYARGCSTYGCDVRG